MGPVVRSENAVWVGSSGVDDVSEELSVAEGMTIFPLSFSKDLVDGHYDGFSNQTLWPLCHDIEATVLQDPEWVAAYHEVNHIFATAVAALAAPGALVWIHDYQLMLLPALLRAIRPDLLIGYFHHIPFPSLPTLQTLGDPSSLVEGVLGSDLVGFQIPEDGHNFVHAVSGLGLGEVLDKGTLRLPGRTVQVEAFPISLDFAEVSEAALSPSVQAKARDIRAEVGESTTIFLGVDRLDYTKGIPQRLIAYGELLDSSKLSVEDTVFIQAGSPSREAVGAYRELHSQIQNIVEDINARHTSSGGRPAIRYTAENLPREDMLALYVAADIMVVTPLRDGMNLVVKEFVASKSDNTGVVVLSAFAGAAHELTDALLVDPTDSTALAEALMTATTMPVQESHQRMVALRNQVRTHDVHHWSESFLSALRRHAR
jgi:trehalose 6-phosphate synthase